jgi:uncharacterized membrane protein YdjX (TVP38/TMEM64 family)
LKDQNIKEINYIWLILSLIILVGLIVLFFYLDRQNQLSLIIRTWGPGGILLSIFLMTALCMTPIYSEGLLILLFKIYGIYEGILIAWLGSLLSSLAIFYLVRYYGQNFFKKLITPERVNKVNIWIQKKGSLGLFLARLLPLPAFVVNYIAGVMSSIKLWPYIWTAALAILPYYVGTALVYIGVAQFRLVWLAVGVVIIFSLWGIGYTLSKKANNS